MIFKTIPVVTGFSHEVVKTCIDAEMESSLGSPPGIAIESRNDGGSESVTMTD